METMTSVVVTVRKGDTLASVDFEEFYFQIPVHPASRWFLCFIFKVKIFQFKGAVGSRFMRVPIMRFTVCASDRNYKNC